MGWLLICVVDALLGFLGVRYEWARDWAREEINSKPNNSVM
jgi:hypothetical protein